MLKIDLENRVKKFLRKLSGKHERQILEKILALAHDPHPFDSLRLEGYRARRADIGEYRVVYYVEGEWLRVPIVGKRNDSEIYKKLRRLFG